MGQEAILRKFVGYININGQPDDNKILLKKRLLSGHCFGFSVCYGAMQAMGKLDWWENVLITLSQWDDEESSLDKEFDLQFIDSDKTPVSQSTTLRKLFERAVNYVVFNQAGHINDFTSPDIDQATILTVPPDDLSTVQKLNYFEITDQGGFVQNIKQYANASGYLSEKDITELLSKAVKSGVICTVQNHNHAISISMDTDNQLMIYDPNYLYTKETIKKNLDMPALVQEIIKILGPHNGLCIEVATFKQEDKKLFNEFNIYMNELVTNKAREILEYNGLNILARHNTKLMLKLLERAARPGGGPIITNIAAALAITNYGRTAFSFLTQRCPESIPTLLKLAAEPGGWPILMGISKALTMQTNEGWTGFHLLIHYSPESIPKLLDLDAILGGKLVLTNIANALTMQTDDGWSGFRILIHYSPELIQKLLERAARTGGKPILTNIATALTIRHSAPKFRFIAPGHSILVS